MEVTRSAGGEGTGLAAGWRHGSTGGGGGGSLSVDWQGLAIKQGKRRVRAGGGRHRGQVRMLLQVLLLLCSTACVASGRRAC